jgi:Ca2+-binding EF-hand superfamily protein
MKKVSNIWVAGATAALFPLAAAIAQTTPPTPAETPPQSQGTNFESLDTDGDGRISKTEAAANESVKAQFGSYDLNGDGFIDRAEVNKANTAKPKTP